METIRATELGALAGFSAGEDVTNDRELVTLRPGAVVAHAHGWAAVVDVKHRGQDGTTRFTATSHLGERTTVEALSSTRVTVRSDVRVDPATLAELPRRGSEGTPDVSGEVAELRSAAYALRVSEAPSKMDKAVADLLAYAAGRLEEHPRATGGMTQASLKVARLVNAQVTS